ncbi:hypothetical protein [Marinoscillum luteum]|uniref:Uncharacterized protein n=1 Tax=Marinoscillum luteum TaxID=861051 RepID=A0ABW7N569_9BACT
MTKFGRIKLTILFATLAICANAQTLSKADFKGKLSKFFSEKYNITYLPNEFYDCSYKEYLDDNLGDMNEAYLTGKKCLFNYIDDIKLSDRGVKMLAEFEDAFVVSCLKQVEGYEEAVYTGRYCKCVHEQYVKYKIGFQDFLNPEFANSEIHQKMLTYCLSINEK